MNYKNEVILAGFLHDIGKFYMRSGKKAGSVSVDGISIGGKHQEISGKFFDRYIDMFKPFVDTEITREMIVRHHTGYYVKDKKAELDVDTADLKFRKYCRIVAEADNISSSEREEVNDTNSSGAGYQTAALTSVFTRSNTDKIFGYKMGIWSANSIIPIEGHERNNTEENLDHIENFGLAMNKLSKTTFGSFEEMLRGLYDVFSKYTWCCPSAYQGKMREISLFDHLVTTSAIAISMYNQLLDTYGEDFTDGQVEKSENHLNTIHVRFNGVDKLINEASQVTYGETDATSLIGKIAALKCYTDELINNSISRITKTSSLLNCVIKCGSDYYTVASDSEIQAIETELKVINKEIFVNSGSILYLSFGVNKLSRGGAVETITAELNRNLLIESLTHNNTWDTQSFIGINTKPKLPITKDEKVIKFMSETEQNFIKLIKISCTNILTLLNDKLSLAKNGDEEYNSISRVSTYLRLVSGYFNDYINEKCPEAINIPIGMSASYIICRHDKSYTYLINSRAGMIKVSTGSWKANGIVVRVLNKSRSINIIDLTNKAEDELRRSGNSLYYCGNCMTWPELASLQKIKITLQAEARSKRLSSGELRKLKEFSCDYKNYLATGDTTKLMLFSLFNYMYEKQLATKRFKEETNKTAYAKFLSECKNWFLGTPISQTNVSLKLIDLCVSEIMDSGK